MKGYQDTRPAYEPLADGETVLAPGQEKKVSELVAEHRMVPVRIQTGTSWYGFRKRGGE